ncbi:ThiF family adenylyltransferase [Candidatus Saccharibacteria bacterium]|nr:MAG: ThiF family adenylyltransferase [Candidatus Saccharibacteria bacterium]
MIEVPVILREAAFSTEQVAHLREKPVWKEVDIYAGQIVELAEIRFPGDAEARQAFIEAHPAEELAGVWVYYPWSGVLLHCVSDEALFELRTNRNKLLITAEEQARLAACTVAVAGMSVGSGIALSCVYSGMSSTIKLADFDTLETANLNRLRESLTAVGAEKLALTMQRIYELNPFANVIPFENGVRDDNIDKFFQDPQTTVVVDEIDDFKMKVELRVKAKAYGVPLLMFTSLGDSILIDVERYDLDPALDVFNGLSLVSVKTSNKRNYHH